MSLKAVHIIFVVVCTVFLVSFGLWAVREFRSTGDSGNLVLALVAFVGAAVLIPYGIWFLRKLKNVSYL